jgi:NAD(P)-dependent dehydrogenase (short-subunit alcohol dehydrogenase family)
VVANSGITGPTLAGLPKDASLLEFRDHLQNWEVDDINNVFAVNTTAVLSTLIAFLELLDKGNKAGNVEQKSQFIATASAGAVCRTSLSGYPYNTSKAATVHMMKMLATKLVDFDIRANVFAPGCEYSDNPDLPKIATRTQTAVAFQSYQSNL